MKESETIQRSTTPGLKSCKCVTANLQFSGLGISLTSDLGLHNYASTEIFTGSLL